MLFTVNKPRLLWDNWLFFWEGKYYLYYLANVEGGLWDRFGLATSDDTLQWKDLGDIMSKDPKAVWMGTGHVWKSPSFDDDGNEGSLFLLQGVTMPFLPTGKAGFVSRRIDKPGTLQFNAFTTWTMKKNY